MTFTNGSKRAGQAFLLLQLQRLSEDFMESELFGHKAGALHPLHARLKRD